MNILIYSDLHLEFAAFSPPPMVRADVVVLAGDIGSADIDTVGWAQSAFPWAEAIVYVPGNHEFYGSCMPERLAEMRSAAAGTRVQVLQGEQFVHGGVRFVGATLWSSFKAPILGRSDKVAAMNGARFRMNDYKLIDLAPERRLQPEDTELMHHQHVAALRAVLEEPFDGPTVVVTHMAPCLKSLAPKYAGHVLSAAYVSELEDDLFDRAHVWVHGHTHQSFAYEVRGCAVLANPRGYPLSNGKMENPAFDDGMTVSLSKC